MASAVRSARRAFSTAFPAPLHFTAAGARISPWHDIALSDKNAAGVYNFVNEIPRGSRAKMEIATDVAFNPILQDKTKKGEPRCVFLGVVLQRF